MTEVEENTKEPKGISFAVIERITQRLELVGSEGLTTYELEVLASLPPNLLQPISMAQTVAERGTSSINPVVAISTPPEMKFSGFSFEHNIEDLIKRRQHCGVESLTSIELEALSYYEKKQSTPSADAHSLSVTHPAPVSSVPAITAIEESPFSQSIQALISGLSFNNLYRRREEECDNITDSVSDCQSSETTHVYTPCAQSLRPSSAPLNLDNDAQETTSSQVRSNADVGSSLLSCDANRCSDDEDSPFHGFSFTENIMELLERRALHGEDSLTSFEKEALEYYADFIPNSTIQTRTTGSDSREETPVTGLTVSTLDATAITTAAESMHHIIGGMNCFDEEVAHSGSGDSHSSAIATASSPHEDFLLEVITARVAAEKLMFDTSSLLEDEDEDNPIKREADEIIRRLEAEMGVEVHEIIHRLENEESAAIHNTTSSPDFVSDSDDKCKVSEYDGVEAHGPYGNDGDDRNDDGDNV